MMKKILIFVIVFIFGFGATFYFLKKNKSEQIVTKITIKDFETLKDTVSKPTVVHFWFSYCTSCVKGLPELEKFCTKNNLQLVHISSDKNNSKMQENLEKITKKYNLKNSYITDDNDLYPTKQKTRNFVGDYCDKIGLNYTKNPGAPYFALLDEKGTVEKEFNSFEKMFNYQHRKLNPN